MIAILVPSKGRPEKFRNMINSIVRTAKTHVHVYLFLQDEKEKDAYAIDNLFANNLTVTGYACQMQPTTVHLWNKLSALALEHMDHKLLMLGADDMLFDTVGWDQALIDHYNALQEKTHVYHLQDSRSEFGTPHPIVTRQYIDAMGYFVPPIFLHWFVDTWTVEIARHNNVFTHLTDYHLIHDKSNDDGQADATHKGIRGMGWRQRDHFVHESCNHFLAYEAYRLGQKLAA